MKKESAHRDLIVERALQVMDEGSSLPVGSEESLTNAKTVSALMEAAQKDKEVEKSLWEQLNSDGFAVKMVVVTTLMIVYEVLDLNRIPKKPLIQRIGGLFTLVGKGK